MNGEEATKNEHSHHKGRVVSFNIPGYKIAIEKKPPRPSQQVSQDLRSPGDELDKETSISLGGVGRRLSQRIKRSSIGMQILPQFPRELGYAPYRQAQIDEAEQRKPQEHTDRVFALQLYAKERRQAEKNIQRATIEAAARCNSPTGNLKKTKKKETELREREKESEGKQREEMKVRDTTQRHGLREAIRNYAGEKQRKDEEEKERIRNENQRHTAKNASRDTQMHHQRRETVNPRRVQHPVRSLQFIGAINANIVSTAMKKLLGNIPKNKVRPDPLAEENIRGRQEGFVSSPAVSMLNRQLGDMTRTILEGYASPEDIRRREEEDHRQERFVSSPAVSVLNRQLGDMTRTILEGYVSPEDIRKREEEDRRRKRL